MNLSSFVYNDIYGSEFAKQKYSSGRKYEYYNRILSIHNKYFQNQDLHERIFRPNSNTFKIHKRTLSTQSKQYDKIDRYSINKEEDQEKAKMSLDLSEFKEDKKQSQNNLYKVEQMNTVTFRIRKKDKVTTSCDFHKSRYHRQQNKRSNILREAKELKFLISNTLEPKTLRNIGQNRKKYAFEDLQSKF